jgi:nucleoside diphosphate kinase
VSQRTLSDSEKIVNMYKPTYVHRNLFGVIVEVLNNQKGRCYCI